MAIGTLWHGGRHCPRPCVSVSCLCVCVCLHFLPLAVVARLRRRRRRVVFVFVCRRPVLAWLRCCFLCVSCSFLRARARVRVVGCPRLSVGWLSACRLGFYSILRSWFCSSGLYCTCIRGGLLVNDVPALVVLCEFAFLGCFVPPSFPFSFFVSSISSASIASLSSLG